MLAADARRFHHFSTPLNARVYRRLPRFKEAEVTLAILAFH